eukprot:4272582-Pyramimonas_sp.AAC.1
MPVSIPRVCTKMCPKPTHLHHASGKGLSNYTTRYCIISLIFVLMLVIGVLLFPRAIPTSRRLRFASEVHL